MVRGFYVFLQEQFWLNAQKDANFSSPSIFTSQAGFKAYFLTQIFGEADVGWMSTMLCVLTAYCCFRGWLPPPIPLTHFVWEDAVLDALSNALPKQFCAVNKSGDFNTGCSGQWGTGCGTSCPSWFCSNGWGHLPQLLATTSLLEVTTPWI